MMDKEVKKKEKDIIIDTIIDIIFVLIATSTGEELSQRLFHSDNILLAILVSVVIYSALCAARRFITTVYYSHKKHGS